jgi:hypothetical protein
MAKFLKLWSEDHQLSVAVRQVVRDVPRVVSEEKAERLNDTLADVLEVPFLLIFKRK